MKPKSLPLPPVGTYVVWGPEKAPEVHLITAELRTRLIERRLSANASRAADAVRYVFGPGFTELVPAWMRDAVESVATRKVDPAPDAVRALCAAIAVGMPFEEFYKRRGGNGGGQRELAQPQPVKPQPGGAAVALAV